MVFFQSSLVSFPLQELSNPGASGSIFYLSEDDEFIIKTVQHKEAEFLQKLLPGYYMVSGYRAIGYYMVSRYRAIGYYMVSRYRAIGYGVLLGAAQGGRVPPETAAGILHGEWV